MKHLEVGAVAATFLVLGAGLHAAGRRAAGDQTMIPSAKLAIHKPGPVFNYKPPTDSPSAYLLKVLGSTRRPVPVMVGSPMVVGCNSVQSPSSNNTDFRLNNCSMQYFSTVPQGALVWDVAGSWQDTINVPSGANYAVVQVSGDYFGTANSASLGLQGTTSGQVVSYFMPQSQDAQAHYNPPPVGTPSAFTQNFAVSTTGSPQLSIDLELDPGTSGGEIRFYTATITFYSVAL